MMVAFPLAYKENLREPIYKQKSDFFIVLAPSDEIVILTKDMPWLKLNGPKAIGDDISQIDYQAKNNTRLPRRAQPVEIKVNGKTYEIKFIQQSGYLVQDEMVRVLNSPLNLDFLVAITYIASLIKKIPVPPIKLIAVIVAALAIVALSIAISLVRRAFINVPEPNPLSVDTNDVPINIFPGFSVPHVLPLKNIAAEDQTIALQTVKELYWLIKQVE
ncbi:hypothetical protein [Nitrosomonas sp.]|uniref:hypothetical protein n=1 Tax=Nitrosomonas sp. TaxID=42353 RepID=UPI0025CF111A|nr:hypothetical protein [Nitrosomonas sp.]MBV6447893.1 hypothetical protein [Nitrosomonas sp.]